MTKLLVPLLMLVAFLATADTPLSAAEFKTAPDSCKNAHAILGWSDFKKIPEETDEEFADREARPWYTVGWVVGRLNWGRGEGKELIKMVDSYEPGVVGQVEFKEYSVKGHDGAKGYVAHCGHGGTCNMVAARVHRLYKGMGKPRVYCGPMPSVLTGGRKPSIPIPSEEELNETDGDGDDDFDFDDDDDDDDDDAKKKKDEPSVDDF
jgi:hypothetical protein